MDESTSKEKVLKKIRNALIQKTDPPYQGIDAESPVFVTTDESLDVAFAQQFTDVSGKFVYCQDINDLVTNLKLVFNQLGEKKIFCREEMVQNILKKTGLTFYTGEKEFLQAEVGITLCEYLIARLGSIMVSSNQLSGRRLNVFPEIHMVIAFSSQLVPDLKQALSAINDKYLRMPSMISLITGPSRTADIEKTIVMGAHGPRELYLFYVDKPKP